MVPREPQNSSWQLLEIYVNFKKNVALTSRGENRVKRVYGMAEWTAGLGHMSQ